ncbi:putative periodic tryptophan protein 2-like isoform X2 [Apostichopus japonicus]|uniref:Putative periodic tryptophan protein 2-like isoform X2 n=1 Tax=Stichopus japonicus TaxID=307972 RepID=A0A2G8KH92_STIJA|nr:putative periodic tryptophan protein 2-like isoform X2 [Apostichopus japonicus]
MPIAYFLECTKDIKDLSFSFSNLLGAVYRKGNICFTGDGDSVISPVGNRITKFDLRKNKSETFPIEARLNLKCVALSPDGLTAILIDHAGDALLCSLTSKTVLHHLMLKGRVHAVKYSPDGKYIAVVKGRVVQVYLAPRSGRHNFNPLQLHRTYYGAYDDNTCVDWTSDSRFFAVGSKDMMTRVFAVGYTDCFLIQTFTGHKDRVVAVFFEENSLNFYSMSRRCDLVAWECNTNIEDVKDIDAAPKKNISTFIQPMETDDKPDEENMEQAQTEQSQKNKNFKITKRKFWFYNNSEVGMTAENTCADYHKKNRILVTGFSSGVFQIHEMPDFNLIHTLSISDQKIAAVTFNPSGDWIAFGCSGLGQLLVWEWQSECYVLKQQGHYNSMSCLDFSPDGQHIATGAEDGKVKLWNTSSGFCFVTFTEHTAGVTGVKFKHTGKVVVSSSLDGTVRAFDLNRYRNFRTFTSPRQAQFSSLAMDASGEIICASAQDTFEVFVWSMQTGRLLEVLSGHEGPVASITFSPTDAVLASVSWDKTLKIWDIFQRKGSRETLTLTTDGLAVSFRPDGKQLAVASLDFQVTFWDIKSASQVGSIEGRRDLSSGRRDTDFITAKRSATAKSFTTLCYSADGECILAAGRAQYVCIYHVKEQLLLKKFEITCNLSLDAMKEYLNRRKMTDFGSKALIDQETEEERGRAISLPGVKSGEMSSRTFKPEVNVPCVRFSPTGRQWAATTTEGLFLFSLDSSLTFDPYDLTLNITPELVIETLAKEDWSLALILSHRLNEKKFIQQVVESIPPDQIDVVVLSLSEVYVEKMLQFAASQLTDSPHLEFYLQWMEKLLMLHGPNLKMQTSSSHQAMLTTLQKALPVENRAWAGSKRRERKRTLEKDEADEGIAEIGSDSEDEQKQDSDNESEMSDTIITPLYK